MQSRAYARRRLHANYQWSTKKASKWAGTGGEPCPQELLVWESEVVPSMTIFDVTITRLLMHWKTSMGTAFKCVFKMRKLPNKSMVTRMRAHYYTFSIAIVPPRPLFQLMAAVWAPSSHAMALPVSSIHAVVHTSHSNSNQCHSGQTVQRSPPFHSQLPSQASKPYVI